MNTKDCTIFLRDLPYDVAIAREYMSIGCQSHNFADWWDFDDKRIAGMDGIGSARFWRDYKAFLFAIIAVSGRWSPPPSFSDLVSKEIF